MLNHCCSLAKLCDNGLAFALKNSQAISLAMWTAPEFLLDVTALYNFKADIYSLGVVLFELCTKQLPFPPPMLFSTTATVPDEWIEITQRCWSQEPAHRPSMESVMSVLNGLPPIFVH